MIDGLSRYENRGIDYGREEACVVIAQNMLIYGIDREIAAKCTGLSLDRIAEIADELDHRSVFSFILSPKGPDCEQTLADKVKSGYMTMVDFVNEIEDRGVELGYEQARIDIARNMLICGIDRDMIAKCTCLSLGRIGKIAYKQRESF